ncbi:tellurium resistance protein [Falsigemmobacter intermedius]|uniref:SLAC1 family transporter n=1 Tax=Falsigemmobacter intermedius TaxID=1553448 RepID=UPI003EFBD6C4
MSALPPPAARQIGARGLFRRMPPAVFPPLLGLTGLGLAWRRASELTALPGALAEMLLGAIFLLWCFMIGAYASKVLRRPSVLREELTLLPGRAGLAAADVSAFLMAAVVAPYLPGLALGILALAVTCHLCLGFAVLKAYFAGPEEARVITPVWQLIFTGYIILPFTLAPLGYTQLAHLAYGYAVFAGVTLWLQGLWMLIRRIPPAPLRPLLAIHLAPASLMTLSSLILGYETAALVFATLASAIFLALVASARWITESGFSPFWGAFTFPLAAFANAQMAMGWQITGIFALIAASAMVAFVASRVWQMWARGTLAIKTNTPTA